MNFMGAKLDHVYLLGALPSSYSHQFEHLVIRAKALIKSPGYFIHDLNDALAKLDHLLCSEFNDYYLDLSNPKSLSNNFFSHAELLYKNLDTIKIPSNEFTWCQLFGILAIAEIENTIQFEYFISPSCKEEQEALDDETLSGLIAATEAVCYGEALEPNRSPFNALVKAERSKAAQANSNKRHNPSRKIKDKFIRYFHEQTSPISKAQTARNFYDTLSDEQKRVLCPTNIRSNAVRTLMEYLKKFERKRQRQ